MSILSHWTVQIDHSVNGTCKEKSGTKYFVLLTIARCSDFWRGVAACRSFSSFCFIVFVPFKFKMWPDRIYCFKTTSNNSQHTCPFIPIQIDVWISQKQNKQLFICILKNNKNNKIAVFPHVIEQLALALHGGYLPMNTNMWWRSKKGQEWMFENSQ